MNHDELKIFITWRAGNNDIIVGPLRSAKAKYDQLSTCLKGHSNRKRSVIFGLRFTHYI